MEVGGMTAIDRQSTGRRLIADWLIGGLHGALTARPDDDRVSSTWAADAATVMIDDDRDADVTAEHRPVA